MKRLATRLIPILCLLTSSLVGCQQNESNLVGPTGTGQADSEIAAESPRDIALAAKQALYQKLSSRLMQAKAKGGPELAISVCNTEASGITQSIGSEFGVAIGRTSFRLRNPDNQPPEWAHPLVEERVADAQYVDLPDGRLGALLPIQIGAECLPCHGPRGQITDDVKAALAEKYPNDQATDFAAGDLRGWFWVEVPAAH